MDLRGSLARNGGYSPYTVAAPEDMGMGEDIQGMLSTETGATLRLIDWIHWILLLTVFTMAAVALGLSIWAVVRESSDNRRIDRLEDAAGSSRSMPVTNTARGPKGSETDGSGGTGGRFNELEDVALGSKHLPLEDGDLLRWQNGKIVNARDPVLEQELGHHLDTRFTTPLRNGHILIRNQTAGQWRNAPLSALLTLGALSDVDLSTVQKRRQFRSATTIPDKSRLEYDQKRQTWTAREPLNQAWMRFCPSEDRPETWGHLEPALVPGRWSQVRPVSGAVGIYIMNVMSHGDIRVSRKDVSITTPKVKGGVRPSGGRPYRLRATVSATGVPPGTWGFLVGNEQAPADGGFVTGGSQQSQHWNIETVRTIPDDRRIVLAFKISTNDDDANDKNSADLGSQIRVQCFQMSVEEI